MKIHQIMIRQIYGLSNRQISSSSKLMIRQFSGLSNLHFYQISGSNLS